MILLSNIITTAITHLPALRCLTPAAAGMDAPLHLSAYLGRTEVTKLLVELKADLAAVDG